MARILVIEDNPANLHLMTYLLTAFGHTAIPAYDGEEGLAVATRERPDLIICDVHLPKMDGYEVCRRMKNDPELRATPLIAVTALAMVGDRDVMLAAGFDGYMAKPIDPQTFVGDVDGFLGNVEPREAPHPTPTPAPPAEPPACGGDRGTILVVDNSAVNRTLLRHTLEPEGFRILLAATVHDALDLLQEHRPALVISDLDMPQQNGFDLIKAMKTDRRWHDIPFVFLTSTCWAEREQRMANALGADRFISRPIDPHALLTEIAACLCGC